MDFLLAGTAAATAGAICNPLEVVKIRMQLQGELQAKGQYKVHYRLKNKWKFKLLTIMKFYFTNL